MRTYKIDALKIPEDILKQVGLYILCIDNLYFYQGIDGRVKEYKI
jgi:hypothetical protein